MTNSNVAGLRTAPLAIPGFAPVEPKDTGADVNPDSSFAHAAAIRAIMLYLLAEAFDLRTEEVTWSGYVLDEVCGELLTHTPHSVPFAARQEMLNGTYTRLLELREKAHLVRGAVIYDRNVVTASQEEWADALLASITAAYVLPPMTENRIRSRLLRLLADLGVGDPENPRGSTHLPTELRQRLVATRRI